MRTYKPMRHPNLFQLLGHPLFISFVVLLLIISRAPKFLFSPAFWGEEGRIFYAEQAQLGWKSISTTYAGYLHLYPRLIAHICSSIPIQHIPLFYHISSLAAHSLLLYSTFRLIASTAHLRFITALATVIIPHNGEVFLNLPNTISILAPIVTLLFFSQRPKYPISILEKALLGIVMLSGPYGLIQLPFLILAWILLGFERHKTGILATCIFFGLIQIYFIDLQVRPQRISPVTLIGLIESSTTFIYYYFFAFLGTLNNFPMRLLIVLGGLILILPKIKSIRCTKEQLISGSTIILVGLSIWAAAMLKGLDEYLITSPLGSGGRYFWPPYVMVSVGLIYLLNNQPQRTVLKVAGVMVLLSSLAHWKSQMPADLPGWRERVLNAPPGPITVQALPSDAWNFTTIKK